VTGYGLDDRGVGVERRCNQVKVDGEIKNYKEKEKGKIGNGREGGS
jgi:hypothetical protein